MKSSYPLLAQPRGAETLTQLNCGSIDVSHIRLRNCEWTTCISGVDLLKRERSLSQDAQRVGHVFALVDKPQHATLQIQRLSVRPCPESEKKTSVITPFVSVETIPST